MNIIILVLELLTLLAFGILFIKFRALVSDLKGQRPTDANYVVERLSQHTAEIVNANALAALNLRFPVFFGGPSVDATHARILIQQLVYRTPNTIAELGSGTSTILIAKAMQLLGSTEHLHVSIDHELRYLDVTKKYAKLNGVFDSIKFAHCPLRSLDIEQGEWYSNVPEALEGRKIDLLIIDGPPAYESGKQRARGPALHVLFPHLAEDCTILLDDANRPGERQIVEQWLVKYPQLKIRRIDDGKGIAILQLGEG